MSPCSHSQVIASGAASTPEEVASYASCTLLAAGLTSSPEGQEKAKDRKDTTAAIEKCVKFLQDQEFIILQKVKVGGEQMPNSIIQRHPLISLPALVCAF